MPGNRWRHLLQNAMIRPETEWQEAVQFYGGTRSSNWRALFNRAIVGEPVVVNGNSFRGCLDGNWSLRSFLAVILICATTVRALAQASTAPVITTSYVSESPAAGSRVSITVAAAGTGPFTYQWQETLDNNPNTISNIPGATTNTLTLVNVQDADDGVYSVTVSNGAGSTRALLLGMTVADPPVITRQPQDQTANPGDTISFPTVWASATPPSTYQILKDGSVVQSGTITGMTDDSYGMFFASVQASDAGTYVVKVTNGAGSATSNPAVLTVNAPVTITAQPTGQTCAQGANVSFTVGVSGTAPFSYQWKFNGTALYGETSATLAMTNVQSGESGTYTVTVGNFLGSVTSSPATLVVDAPPTVTSPPSSIDLTEGGGIELSPPITGSRPFTYQWQKDGQPIPGATDQALSLSNVQASDAGTYSTVVTNAYGTTTVTVSTVTVDIPPDDTSPPQGQPFNSPMFSVSNVTQVYSGSPEYVTVTTTPSGLPFSITYYYYGFTKSSILYTVSAPTEAGVYAVEILSLDINHQGGVPLGDCSLVIQQAPVVVTLSGLQQTYNGNPHSATVTLNPPGPPFTVEYGGPNGPPPVHAGSYSVQVIGQNSDYSFTGSTTGTLVIAPAAQSIFFSLPPAPVVQGVPFTISASATSGQTVTFSIVSGSATATGVNGSTITLNDSSPVVIRATQTGGGDYQAASADITISTLTYGLPTIVTPPANQTAGVGGSASFSVAVTAGGALTYQWQMNGINIPGATNASLTLNNLQLSDNGSTFAVVVTDATGSVTSSAANLYVSSVPAAPVIETQPTSQTVAAGTTVNLTVAANGNPAPTYQWTKGGVNIAGATGATYTIPSVQLGDAGNYAAIVSNSSGSVTSGNAILAVNAPTVAAPTISSQPQAASASAGTSITLTVAAAGNPAPTYQWFFNGQAIAGATNASYSIASAQVSNSGSYTVVATNSAGSATSSAAMLTVTAPSGNPTITAQPASQTIAMGSTVVFSVNSSGVVQGSSFASSNARQRADASGTSATYQWYLNGTAIAGATNAILVVQATASSTGAYTCLVSNSNGSVLSNAATLAVSSAPASPGRLINLSTLAVAGSGSQTLTVGFFVGGTGTAGSQSLLVQALGPTVATMGQTGVMPDPQLNVFSGQTVIGSNTGWGAPLSNQTAVIAADAATYATALGDPTSKDSAVVVPLAPGGYTVQVSSVSGVTGKTLTAFYDDTPSGAYTAATPRLINLSCRLLVGSNSSLTAGFWVGGTTAKTVLIRADGPALAAQNVTGVMPDPQLTVYNSADAPIAYNAGWGGSSVLSSVAASVYAQPFTDPNSKDSEVLLTLPPGGYTAQVSSASNTAGNVMIEVYEVP